MSDFPSPKFSLWHLMALTTVSCGLLAAATVVGPQISLVGAVIGLIILAPLGAILVTYGRTQGNLALQQLGMALGLLWRILMACFLLTLLLLAALGRL